MSRKELALYLRAYNQTNGAFQGVSRDLQRVTQQIAQFSLASVSLRSVTTSAFGGLGNVVTRTSGVVSRGLLGMAVQMNRLGALFDQRGAGMFTWLNKLGVSAGKMGERLGGPLGGMLNRAFTPQKGQMFSAFEGGLLNLSGRLGGAFSGVAGVLGGLAGGIAGVGRSLGPVIGLFGALGGVALEVLSKIGGAVLRVAGEIGSQLVAAIQRAMLVIGGLAAFATVDILRVAGSFEAGMNRVRAVSGATGAEFEALRNQAAELGRTTQFTASQAADAMGFLAMAGFKANEVLGAMPSTLQLAAAANMDLGRAADITSNILTGFGLTVAELGHANDVLVRAMTATNVDLSMLGESMKYVGPIAKSAGIQFEEVVAAIGLLGNAGIQGSMAGTSIRGALSRLLNPTREAAHLMASLGVSATDSSGRLHSLANIVAQLQRAGADTAAMLTIFGDRAGPGMAALVSQGSEALRKLTQQLGDSAGTAERIANAMMQGFGGAWKKFTSVLGEAKLAIADSGLLKFATQFVNRLTAMVPVVTAQLIPVLQALGQVGVNAIQWIGQNWATIWPIIANLAIGAIRLVGGGIAGLINVFREFGVVQKNGQLNFQNMGESIKKFAIVSIDSVFRLSKQLLGLVLVFGELKAAIGLLTKNVPMVIAGVITAFGAMAGTTWLQNMRNDAIGAINALDKLPDKFKALEKVAGVKGAFARGFMGFQRQMDTFLAQIPNAVPLPKPGRPPGQGGLGAATAPALAVNRQVQESLQAQLGLLERHAQAWEAIVLLARTHGATLTDAGQASRQVLTALFGQLDAQNRLQGAQRALMAAQQPFSAEWLKALQAVAATAEGVARVRNEIRDLLFDTSRLTAATDVSSKIFELGKEAGFRPEQMQQLAAQQQGLLMQTLQVESARLATLQAGTAEWHKQRGTVVDLISRVVQLRKELSQAQGQIPMQLRGFARTPFGTRGVGPERGRMPAAVEGDLARVAQQLLQFALNPPAVSLDAEARRIFGGGAPMGMLPGGPDAQRGPLPGMNATANVHFNGPVNDLETMRRLASEAAGKAVAEAFGRLFNAQRDRGTA